MPKDEIVRRGIICGEIPLYSLGRLIDGFGGLGALMGAERHVPARWNSQLAVLTACEVRGAGFAVARHA
jgi:hypothetical protein